MLSNSEYEVFAKEKNKIKHTPMNDDSDVIRQDSMKLNIIDAMKNY